MIDSIAPLTVLGVTALVARRIHHTWLNPGAFFPLAWFFFSLVPILFATEFEVKAYGLWVISAIAVSVTLGSLIGSTVNNDGDVYHDVDRSLGKIHTVIPAFIFVLSFASLIGVVLLYFFGISRFNLTTSLFNLLILPNEFSVDRYQGITMFPIHIRILMYLVFPASLLGGFSFTSADTKRKSFLFLVPVIISLMYGSLLTTRSTILLAIILWIAGYLGSRVFFIDQLDRLFKPKTLMIFFISFIGFTLLFAGTQILRQQSNTILIDQLILKLKVYFFGYLPAFSSWIDKYHNDHLGLGTVTFAGPFNLLGLIQRKLGFYEDIVVLGSSHTNVYTAIRGLITDFSLPGTLILSVLIGCVMSIAFRKCLNGASYWLIPLTMFYAFTLYSPLISIFNYNSVMVAWVMMFSLFAIIPNSAEEKSEKDSSSYS